MANDGGTQTFIEPEAARAIIARMGKLMDDVSTFQELRSLEALAGNFTTAAWLKELLRERQDLVVLHGDELKSFMHELEQTLVQATEALEQADKDNADRTTGY
jgi:hypothetical protein